MPNLLESVKIDFSHLRFEPGEHFVWQPAFNTVSYVDDLLETESGSWSLLHELGHARLGHKRYRDDLQLMMMEVQAWNEAITIARDYGIIIDEKHIDDCLESYRNWLHKRSRCIDCKTSSLQQDVVTYQCHNCQTKWTVPESKICKIRKTRIS